MPAQSGGNRHELKWQLIRSFFRSRSRFLRLFDRYEARVLAFAERFKTDRSSLKLGVEDLLTLFDYKSLEALRDREVLTLKETAHELFRGADETDRFDHYVSNIYHELSILKEEHYTLKGEFVRTDAREYDRIFREADEFYPKRLRHLRNLYKKALRRLEELLPNFAHERILVRSIYLFGGELVAENYPRGLKGLYAKMYPEFADAEGFAVAGDSFFGSGFLEEARDAYALALPAARRRRRRNPSERLDALIEEVVARLDTTLRELTEAEVSSTKRT
jgi:hypothetical protein